MTKKGFAKPSDPPGTRFVAVELNRETLGEGDGFLVEAEVEDTIEIHHLSIAPVNSKRDARMIAYCSDLITDVYISPAEFLAEMYVTSLNRYALKLGANVARIYHNSTLGDTRIHANSIGHVFEESEHDRLPPKVQALVKKYVTIKRIAPGDKITLTNRLGL